MNFDLHSNLTEIEVGHKHILILNNLPDKTAIVRHNIHKLN